MPSKLKRSQNELANYILKRTYNVSEETEQDHLR